MGSRPMKTLLIIPFLVFFSCSKHESQETVNPYDAVKEKAASYLEQIDGYSIDKLFKDRCDSLTFKALGAAFVKDFGVMAHEYAPGEWHRDIVPCYPDDSRSEISFDGLLGVLHFAWTRQDRELLTRINNYAVEHNYIMGEGDEEFTRVPQIGLLINEMLGAESFLSNSLMGSSTHREHILAVSAWLKLRYAGHLNSAEVTVLKSLKANPMTRAILARVDDGDQDETIKYLSDFPSNLPLDTSIESWGGCPSWLYFFLLKALIDGD